MGRGGTDAGLWKVGTALLVAWASEASVALFIAPSGTAVVVRADFFPAMEVSGEQGANGKADGRSL